MMIDITIQFEVDDRPVEPEEVADEYLAEMLRYTREQIREDVTRKLADVRCPEHNTQPRVTVTGTYDTAAEQMELSYHVDSCCQIGLLRAVSALNH
ncbi:MAG: hypothetical protein K8I30_10105 [Anaerolineae bacterium]|nr:hypothetical protein [Anaerolineae bacterium]